MQDLQDLARFLSISPVHLSQSGNLAVNIWYFFA